MQVKPPLIFDIHQENKDVDIQEPIQGLLCSQGALWILKESYVSWITLVICYSHDLFKNTAHQIFGALLIFEWNC